MHSHHALARFMVGDLGGAEESFERSMARCDGLEFPQGPWSGAYAAWLASWMWIEAGQLDRADDLAARINSSSARHGFDNWELIGATHMAALEGARLLHSDSDDAHALAGRGEAIASMIQLWEALGLRVFLTFYMTIGGALFAAAGDRDQARRSSTMRSHSPNRRACTSTTPRRTGASRSSNPSRMPGSRCLRKALDIARSQGARPFELRISRELDELERHVTTPR